MRSRRALTWSVKSEKGSVGSGKKSWGCQHFSTGLSNGNTFWVAQVSSDLKTSTFSGGIECVLGFGGAATAEIFRNEDAAVRRWWAGFGTSGEHAAGRLVEVTRN